MYLWNTQQLIEDLRQNQLTEADFKNYYLTAGILMLLSMFLMNYGPSMSGSIASAYLLCGIGLLISWLNVIFKANGGVNGQHFLNRFVALYVPISLKMLLLSIFIAIVVEIMWMMVMPSTLQLEVNSMNDQLRWLIMDQIILCFTYWRIYLAMQKINA